MNRTSSSVLSVDFERPAGQRDEMPKKSQKTSRKPTTKPVSAKPSKPKVKTATTKSPAKGFTRVSETHIRKVYR